MSSANPRAAFPAASQLVVRGDRVGPAANNLFGGSIYLDDASSLEIEGIGLSDTLINPAADGGEYSEYSLSGSLDNGTPLPGDLLLYVENGTGASFELVNDAVPEPGTVALLGAGGISLLGLVRRCRVSM